MVVKGNPAGLREYQAVQALPKGAEGSVIDPDQECTCSELMD
jgi:hypothetical protein